MKSFSEVYNDRLQWFGTAITVIAAVITYFYPIGYIGMLVGFGVVLYGARKTDREMTQFYKNLRSL